MMNCIKTPDPMAVLFWSCFFKLVVSTVADMPKIRKKRRIFAKISDMITVSTMLILFYEQFLSE